jgi:hypothetical protein
MSQVDNALTIASQWEAIVAYGKKRGLVVRQRAGYSNQAYHFYEFGDQFTYSDWPLFAAAVHGYAIGRGDKPPQGQSFATWVVA